MPDLKSIATFACTAIGFAFVMPLFFNAAHVNPKNKPFLGIAFAVLVLVLSAISADLGEDVVNGEAEIFIGACVGTLITYIYLYAWGWRFVGETNWSAEQKRSKVPRPERNRKNWQYRSEVKRQLWWGPCCQYFYYCSSRSVGFNEQFVWHLEVCCSQNIPTADACRAIEACLLQGRYDIEKCRKALYEDRCRLLDSETPQ